MIRTKENADQLAFLLSESELLLTAIEKIAFSGQRTLQFDDHPFEVGVREPNPFHSGIPVWAESCQVPQALSRIGHGALVAGLGSSIEADSPSS